MVQRRGAQTAVPSGSPGSLKPSVPVAPPTRQSSSGSVHGCIMSQRGMQRGADGAGAAVPFQTAQALLLGQPASQVAVHSARSPSESQMPKAQVLGSGFSLPPRQLWPTPPGTLAKQDAPH